MTNNMLSLGKLNYGNMEYYNEKIDICSYMESIYNACIIPIENKWLSLEIEIDKQLKNRKLYLDKDKLTQVITNLISNAIKFSKAWGSITITLTKKEENILIEVKDNGIWIPKDQQKIIFEKYKQYRNEYNNSYWLGIGLALSSEFVKHFWWNIEVNSSPGNGSNFFFTIPLLKE